MTFCSHIGQPYYSVAITPDITLAVFFSLCLLSNAKLGEIQLKYSSDDVKKHTIQQKVSSLPEG